MAQGPARSGRSVAHRIVSPIDWSAATRTCHGESESGDAYLVRNIPHGLLIGVADGLGHGLEAAKSAHAALDTAGAHATDPLTVIAQRCHSALRGMRGAALTLVTIDADTHTLTWLGVGTVAGTLFRRGAGTRESLLLRVGLLGQRAPVVATATLSIAPGDTLVLVTNGVRWYSDCGSIPRDAPSVMARRLLAENASAADDALVVVARYHGRVAPLDS